MNIKNYYDLIPKELFFDGCAILDIGANEGKNQLASRYAKFFVDASFYEGIEIRKLPNNGLNIFNMDVLDYIPSKKFDLIICMAVVEHIAFSSWPCFISNMKKWLNTKGFIVLLVPHDELLNDYITSLDYQKCLDSGMPCHVVHGITKKVIELFLPNTYFIIRRYPIRFREPDESILRSVLRFVKRFFTGHPYVWNGILRRKYHLIAVWKKERD